MKVTYTGAASSVNDTPGSAKPAATEQQAVDGALSALAFPTQVDARGYPSGGDVVRNLIETVCSLHLRFLLTPFHWRDTKFRLEALHCM